MYQQIVGRFHTISFSIIIGICFLLPFFFLPASLAGIGAVKGAVLTIGVLLAFSLWVVAQFIEGSFKIPRNAVLAAIGAWVLVVLASAITSSNSAVSLWGRGFVLDSFATSLMLAIFTFLVAVYAREQRKLIKLFLAAFSGSVLTILLQVILFSLAGVPFVAEHFGHIARQGTLVGSWVDFAHFVTFTFLFALLMYEVLAPRGFFRFLSLAAMVLSFVSLAFLNFKTAWVITIIAALLVFVYKSSVERSIARFWEQDAAAEGQQTAFPITSFAALLIGLFFFLSSSSIGASLANMANISFADIRPSFSSSAQVLRSSLAQDPVFGAGAGRYAEAWNLYHPAGVNQTVFWNTSFDAGYSSVVTHATTNGPIAALLLLAAIALAIVHGVRLFNASYPDRFSRFIAVTALIMLFAFAALVLFGSPSITLTAYGFMYLGLLVGVSVLVGRTRLATLNYLRDPRMSFFAILLLVVTAMIGFSAVYFAGTKFASIISYNRALAAADFAVAERRINRALAYSTNDIYLRTRAALYTSQFGRLAAAENPDTAMLQTYFTAAERSAQSAVAWDRTSAGNWLTLSQVYRLVTSANNADAYATAKAAADEALARNPNNPAYVLNLAQLEVSRRNLPEANGYIDAALALKPDYLDAYLLRAQIRAAQGNPQGARDILAEYTRVAPFDAQGYMILGNTELDRGQYQSALDAFSRARQLAPNNPTVTLAYINTLVQLGRRSDAIAELEQFRVRYPQVQGVQEQIDRLRAGASSVTVPADDEEEETQ